MTINVIAGTWLTREITVDGVLLDPAPGNGLWNCPDGFIWGYQGNGPDQLGLALLYQITQSENLARELRAACRDQILVNLPQESDFIMEIDFREWVYQTLANRANLVIPNVTDPGNPVTAHKYLFESRVNGFIAASLGMSEGLVWKCVNEANFQAPESKITIAPQVFISRDKKTIQAVTLNYPDMETYEHYLEEVVSVSPRYMAFTYDGIKEPDAEPGNEINAYLVIIYTPNHAAPHIYEIEYGLEDGGWVANPNRLQVEEGYLFDLTHGLGETYKKQLGL